MPSVFRCAFRSSTAHSAADAGHDVYQGQDSCGFQGARAAKSGTGSLVREPLAGCVDVRVFEEGWECPLCEAKALHHGPVGLDAGERAEPLLHLTRHVRLAPLCTGLSWLIVTSTIASCRWLVASRFCDCCHRDVLLHDNVFCDCGHRELHRLPTSPLRWWLRPQIFDTAVHGVGANHTWRWSPSTSQLGGVSPSAPRLSTSFATPVLPVCGAILVPLLTVPSRLEPRTTWSHRTICPQLHGKHNDTCPFWANLVRQARHDPRTTPRRGFCNRGKSGAGWDMTPTLASAAHAEKPFSSART